MTLSVSLSPGMTLFFPKRAAKIRTFFFSPNLFATFFQKL
jgi:hypothetical protein